MSFFEKMMRINHAEKHQKWIDSDPNEEEPLRRSTQGHPEESRRRIVSESKMEEDMPEVPQEPKPYPIYVSVKPVLLSSHLPKREQLLRDMMAKKREFELKKMANSNINRGVQLKQRLEESSFKFTHAQIKHAEQVLRPNISNQSLQIAASIQQNQLNPPPSSSKNSQIKQPKKSLKESLVLDISQSSTHKQSLSSNLLASSSVPPVAADPLGRQIMMRLLDMLQNQRNDRKDFMAMSMSNQHAHHEREKEVPIVINNILKTPVDALNKDLIQRQMKIKMLQNNRSKQKSFFNFGLNAAYTQQKSDNPLTQRSEIPKCNEFNNGTAQPRNSKTKISLQCSRISIQSKRDAEVSTQAIILKQQEKETKPSSNFSSQIQQNDPSAKPKKQRERNFNRNKSNKNEESGPQSVANTQQKTERIHSQSIISQTIVHKASIRLDIPLSQGSDTQGLTLAEAFKKRIGKLKSQKQKSQKETKRVPVKTIQTGFVNDQNYMKTEVYPQYTTPKQPFIPLFPLQSSQTVNLKESAKTKKAQKPRNTNTNAKEQGTSSKNSREPSRELIDRLISGQRAKVSKKEMYALTRKNYENLPQIQAKKKEEEKKQMQRERLAKIRELQRSTRSLKQVKMTLQ